MHVRLGRRPRHVPRLAAAGMALFGAALALVSAGGPLAKAATTPASPSSDPFYDYSGSTPLSKIAPGTVLKKRAVSLKLAGVTVPVKTDQVLYRTTGERGQPTVTVDTVIQPLHKASGARKIVAYQIAYDALGSGCDPSYTLRGGNNSDAEGQAEEPMLGSYLAAGYTVTVPDYEGEAMDWGAGQESGYNTLDAIRATENYMGLPSSTKVGMVGYSGGSIASEWASELAPKYAPSLNIVGSAIGGVPVDYAHNLNYINGDVGWSGIIPAILSSLPRSLDVSVSKYLSPYGKKVLNQVSGECITQFAASYPGLTIQKMLLPRYSNPYKIPAIVNILNHMIMGNSPGRPGSPMLIGVGNYDTKGDGLMIAGDEKELAYEYAQRGVPVTFREYPGMNHITAMATFETDAFTFLKERLAGINPPDSNATLTPGNSLAPIPEPSS
ncbi:MAG: hypothetical protein J2P25_17155 [Nocardiopsaceae bacterium]|nr:hypothetical protein [Nocardiopsaceae bacterium]